MYTSGRTVKSSKGRKPTTTVSATRDARRIVQKLMPGVGATVNSRVGWDLDANRETVVTTVTFPPNHKSAFDLWTALIALPNATNAGHRDSCRMVVTRTV